jgi:cytochrome c-type biogenesis protein CcmH
MKRALFALLLLLSPALAIQPDEVMKDPAQEARARAIGKELRCLVCQNQSIDDSDAPLARDLRILVRQRIAQGDSDAAVKDYVVARYGTYVLLKPPFAPETWLLWFGPFLLIAVGGLGVLVWYRRRPLDTAPLTAEEAARLKSLEEGDT